MRLAIGFKFVRQGAVVGFQPLSPSTATRRQLGLGLRLGKQLPEWYRRGVGRQTKAVHSFSEDKQQFGPLLAHTHQAR